MAAPDAQTKGVFARLRPPPSQRTSARLMGNAVWFKTGAPYRRRQPQPGRLR